MPLSPYRSVARSNLMNPADIGTSLQQMPYDHINVTNKFTDDDDVLPIIRSGKILLYSDEAALISISIAVSEPRPTTKQDAWQTFVRQNYESDKAPDRTSRLCSVPTVHTTDARSHAGTYVAEDMSRMTSNESHHGIRGRPVFVRTYTLPDQEIPGAEDTVRSVYNAESGVPFTEVPLTLVPSNAYVGAEGSILAATTPLAVVPSNAYTDVDDSMLRTPVDGNQQVEDGSLEVPIFLDQSFGESVGSAEKEILQTDEAFATSTYNEDFDLGIQMGREYWEDPLDPLLFQEPLPAQDPFGGLLDEAFQPSVFQEPLSAQDIFGGLSGEALDPLLFQEALPTQDSFGGLSDDAAQAFSHSPALSTQYQSRGSIDQANYASRRFQPVQYQFRGSDDQTSYATLNSPALPTQGRFPGLTDQGTYASPYSPDLAMQDPFPNLSDEAARNLLHLPDNYNQGPSYDAYTQDPSQNANVNRNQSIGQQGTFVRPSIPASQNQLRSNDRRETPTRDQRAFTPVSGTYPSTLRWWDNQDVPRFDYKRYNMNTQPVHRDYFFPSVIDDLGPQKWFPTGRDFYTPTMIYSSPQANYYWNVGYKTCQEQLSQAFGGAVDGIDTGHRAFSASKTSSHLAPLPLDTTSAKLGTTATGHPGSPVYQGQTSQRRTQSDAIDAGRHETGLPTGDLVLSDANTSAERMSTTGVLGGTSTTTSGTNGQETRQPPRRRRPRDSGTIGPPISIPQIIGGLGGSATSTSMPLIRNPAKRAKGPTPTLKLSQPKRRERQPATPIAFDDTIIPVPSTRRKVRPAISVERDDLDMMPRSTKRIRVGATSLVDNQV
ncbi:hypothetical protein MMC11_005269 [Xylographa trunciseda]|nr:hypothetical protein [Xylographa trunciseda]